jgi:hypothetical protein
VGDRLLLLDMRTLRHPCWHSGTSVVMTNGLPSKPIPPSWPAPRSFFLRAQPPAASLAEAIRSPATPSRAARETSGACPPTRKPFRVQRTKHQPTTAPIEPRHRHRQTTSAKESTTSPPAPRPTLPHRVTLLPTLVAHSFAVPGRAKPGLRARPQADATSTRSAVPGFGVRGFSFDHPTPCKAHPQSPDREGVGSAGETARDKNVGSTDRLLCGCRASMRQTPPKTSEQTHPRPINVSKRFKSFHPAPTTTQDHANRPIQAEFMLQNVAGCCTASKNPPNKTNPPRAQAVRSRNQEHGSRNATNPNDQRGIQPA